MNLTLQQILVTAVVQRIMEHVLASVDLVVGDSHQVVENAFHSLEALRGAASGAARV
jgi:hypothetical protein